MIYSGIFAVHLSVQLLRLFFSRLSKGLPEVPIEFDSCVTYVGSFHTVVV